MGIKHGPPDNPPRPGKGIDHPKYIRDETVIYIQDKPKRFGIGYEELKQSPDWLLCKTEEATDRYIEAENLLCDLLPFWKRVFGYKKIRKYLDKVIKGT
ncbi:MAG: hypothetical protein PHX80_03715 [Candidatus Nanoarchaeia archaeon]|nr:hypothetical protein [Candidatus Nanoarchaeia archaeon]